LILSHDIRFKLLKPHINIPKCDLIKFKEFQISPIVV